MDKFSRIITAFLFIFLFGAFFFSPQKSYAAACNSSNYNGQVACIPSQISCAADGGTSVSGATCGGSERCCCYSGSGTCTLKPAPNPTCSSRGAYCAPGGVCNAESPPATRVSGTGCTGGDICCCFDGNCPIPPRNCTDRTRIRTFTDNSSTNWRVSITYYNPGNAPLPYTANSNPADGYTYIGNPGFHPGSDDWFIWATACVDPRVDVEGYNFLDRHCVLVGGNEYDIWQFDVDVACHNIGYNSTANRVYAGCGSNYTNDFDTVDEDAFCPTNSCYCTDGGTTSYPNNCCVNGVKYCAPNGYECGNPPCTTPGLAANRTQSSSCNASNNPQITMNWGAGTNADEYNIQYSRSGSSTIYTLNGITGTSRSTTANIALNTDYQWRIQSVNNCTGNTTAVSNWTSSQWTSIPRTPATCATTPPVPTNVTATTSCTSLTASRIVVSWNAVGSATSYDVRYRTAASGGNPAGSWQPANDPNSGITTTNHTINNLLLSRSYNYQVRSRNSAGTSAWVPANPGGQITTANNSLCPNPTFSVTGNVWRDTNNNGARNCQNPNNASNCNDPGVAGTLIEAMQGATVRGSDTTGANGNYTITPALAAGNYTLRVTPASGHAFRDIRNSTNTTVLSATNNYGFAVGPNRVYNVRLIASAATYSVAGNVFVDTDGDGTRDTGEANYTGSVNVRATSSTGTPYNDTGNGTYNVSSLPNGTYTLAYTNPPAGYEITRPSGGQYPGVTLPCNSQTDTGDSVATCTGSNGVQNLNFGINNSEGWIQTTDGDTRDDGGYDYNLPGVVTNQCDGRYASVDSAPADTLDSAGVVYSGDSTSNFGAGSASLRNWNVDAPLGEKFSPVVPKTIRTAYSYLLANVRQSNQTERSLTPYCGGGGTANCNLSGNPPEGVYVINGPLNITSSGRYTFPDGTPSNINNFLILASGDITIGREIWVGNNSSVLFASGADIRVRPNVGSPDPFSSTANLKGIYSANRNFIVESNNNCAVQDDVRLNVEGNIVANAGLLGGGVTLQRSLCGNLNRCPALSVKTSPRLLLLTPGILKIPSYVWKEVAP